MHLQILGISAFGIGALFNEVARLKAKVLPQEKASWFSWGVGNKWSNMPGYALMVMGGLSFIAGLFYGNKAEKVKPPVQGVVNPAISDPQPSESSCTGKHLARYQNEISENIKSL